MADSAGVRVSALKAEIAIENAMVSANWRNRMPVVPGKNATGTNTATSTSDVAMTAPATSFMASGAALWESRLAFLNVALDVFDHHDGVIHHQSGGQRDAEQRQRIDRKPQQLDEGESSDQRNRNGHRGNNRAAPVLREK